MSLHETWLKISKINESQQCVDPRNSDNYKQDHYTHTYHILAHTSVYIRVKEIKKREKMLSVVIKKEILPAYRKKIIAAGLEETQTGIKISWRNINNLRYADYTTLMAESEEK